MVTKKLSLVVAIIFILFFSVKIKSQSCVGIVLNEYSASNAGVPLDAYGAKSDWVEIYNAFSNSVTLSGYYLSNDRNNLFKWKFPSTFTMAVGAYKPVWLSGKNTYTAGEHHANFDLQQCKSQWLILTTPAGVVRDSVFVQKTQAGHSRERMTCAGIGIAFWRLYPGNTFLFPNPPPPPSLLTYKDYMPTPSFSASAGVYDGPGDVALPNDEIAITLNGQPIDSAGNCYEVWYTTNGEYPLQSGGNSTLYTSTVQILNAKTTMYRAVTYPRELNPTVSPTLTPGFCFQEQYLPSFCETNTYFYDTEYSQIQPEFGLVSIAIHSTDINWMAFGGSTGTPTIHVEYFDNIKHKAQVTEGYAKMYRPVQESWRTDQKGIYITIDDRLGSGCNFEGNIFNVAGLGVTTRSVFPTLHLKGGDFESNSLITSPSSPTAGIVGTGIRDVFYQSLAAKNNLNVNPLHIKPVVAFINGVYQGVFDLREIYDQYYEGFYNGQSKDSVDLNILTNGVLESTATNGDGTPHTQNSPLSAFKTGVYDVVMNNSMVNSNTFYKTAMSRLDKQSFIDYFVLGTYAYNSDFWTNNIAFGRGNQANKLGTKWHYYLWNTPTIFSFSVAGNSAGIVTPFNSYATYPCSNMYSSNIAPVGTTPTTNITPNAFNGHGNMMWKLFQPNVGNAGFQLEYKNRYQDLLNGPLRCDNILAHFDYIESLYRKEMRNHSDPAYTPTLSPYSSLPETWDTNMVRLRRAIAYRCDWMINGLKKCYPSQGPYPITVDVEPPGAGVVKLNTIVLPYYKWTGNYFQTTLSFKAIPTNTTYTFHHWEFKVHQPLNSAPLSLDSVAISFVQNGQINEDVIAVFTDKSSDITQNGEFANMPSAFSPNGDNINEVYMPLGSAAFAKEYDFKIYNRWGQEVFRSTDPSFGWDGNFEGQKAQTGVYAWVITYKNIYNEAKLAKGNVTLIR